MSIVVRHAESSVPVHPEQLNHRKGSLSLPVEENILPRIADGESSAVADCLHRYGGLVWSLARRFSPDEQSAEDAVQDVFIQLWKNANRFDASIAAEKTFVAMITRRRLIDISRRKSWPSSSQFDFDKVGAREKSASDQAELSDEAAKAAQLLSDLPDDQQKVIRLSIYDGLSHSKIAELTGISLGTVKTHIRRGLLKLRSALFEKGPITNILEFGEELGS
ncbi:MAG: sigma-70 family RNA polymerase sigma factor [Planctomycetota bacterium]